MLPVHKGQLSERNALRLVGPGVLHWTTNWWLPCEPFIMTIVNCNTCIIWSRSSITHLSLVGLTKLPNKARLFCNYIICPRLPEYYDIYNTYHKFSEVLQCPTLYIEDFLKNVPRLVVSSHHDLENIDVDIKKHLKGQRFAMLEFLSFINQNIMLCVSLCLCSSPFIL